MGGMRLGRLRAGRGGREGEVGLGRNGWRLALVLCSMSFCLCRFLA